jgi:hypothetical protein
MDLKMIYMNWAARVGDEDFGYRIDCNEDFGLTCFCLSVRAAGGEEPTNVTDCQQSTQSPSLLVPTINTPEKIERRERKWHARTAGRR